jgi:hypothetical protein
MGRGSLSALTLLWPQVVPLLALELLAGETRDAGVAKAVDVLLEDAGSCTNCSTSGLAAAAGRGDGFSAALILWRRLTLRLGREQLLVFSDFTFLMSISSPETGDMPSSSEPARSKAASKASRRPKSTGGDPWHRLTLRLGREQLLVFSDFTFFMSISSPETGDMPSSSEPARSKTASKASRRPKSTGGDPWRRLTLRLEREQLLVFSDFTFRMSISSPETGDMPSSSEPARSKAASKASRRPKSTGAPGAGERWGLAFFVGVPPIGGKVVRGGKRRKDRRGLEAPGD